MTNKQKLWFSFGPVLFALLMVYGVLHFDWTKNYSSQTLYRASISQNDTVFKGEAVKNQEFKHHYIPFYGSSELSRMDALHPSVIAKKYKYKNKPFLLGSAGTQSLVNYMSMQGSANQLRHKKIVVIVSPQWFTTHGQLPNAFEVFYSPLQMTNFLLQANPNSEADRYASARFASMPGPKGLVLNSLNKIANGKKLSSIDTWRLQQLNDSLANQDKFFSTIQLRDRRKLVKRGTKHLPKKYSVEDLDRVANRLGKKGTSNNNLGIRNKFYTQRLTPDVLKRMKGKQRKLNYVKSPEYSDFELMLNQFAKQDSDVLFIIPPVNAKWMKYTGLSQDMLDKTITKIKTQLISQGFGNIADLSQNGNKKYYMEDTIHLGWRGWVDVDKAVSKFMKTKRTSKHYSMNNYFYNQQWQERSQFKTGKMIPNLKAK